MTRAAVIARLARVGAGTVRDRVRPEHPLEASKVPGTTAALTTEWLTDALGHDGARVTAFEVVGGSDGTSSRRALKLTWDRAGDLPGRVFTKSTTTFTSRALLGVTGITLGESTFYNHLRPLVTLRSPTSRFAAADAGSCRSIVVMDDLAAEGWTFPDPMHDTFSERDAEDMMDQFAAYHAAFWEGRAGASALKSLPTALAFQRPLNAFASFEQRFERGLERSLEHLPPALGRRAAELWPAVMWSLVVNANGPETLLHQDLHQGNWLRDPDGRVGLYDWQCVARGNWALDVAYGLAAVLATDDRRAWERDLVNRYVAALAEHGVPDPPSPEAAWLEVRRQPWHAFAFGVFTNGQGRFQPAMQPHDYTMRSIERIGITVDDWDSLEALT